ncbi:MAG: host attachment protein [Kiloniellales bacterium]
MKPIRTWILLADGSRARFLLHDGPGKGLKSAPLDDREIEVPPTRDLGSQRPGRSHDRFGQGRHAMEETDWHRFEEARFAKEVAGLLNQAAKSDSYDRLILVAPPKTLGDLRQALDSHSSKLIYRELGKDLTKIPDSQLPEHLDKVIAV